MPFVSPSYVNHRAVAHRATPSSPAFKIVRPFTALAVLAATTSVGCSTASQERESTSTGIASSLGQNSTSSASGGNSAGASAEAGDQSTGSTDSAPSKLDLRIQFEAKVGAARFVCGQTFANVGTNKSSIDPVDFRFYVHNLRLIDLEGNQVPVTIPDRELWQAQGVALLDFENDGGSCRFGGDPGLNSVVTGTAPGGFYKGLRFTLGVPADLNHQDPLSLGAPFQSGGMQWNWLTGFKFLALEFRSGESSGLLHIGSTACKGGGPDPVACSKSNRAEIFLPNFEPGVSRIAADLGVVFANSDLSVDQICHSDKESCAPMFAQAGVAWESGLALDAQSFFTAVGQGVRQAK